MSIYNLNKDPILEVFSFIGKKWVLLIIKSISDGCKCFSDIEKVLNGINPRILSTRLKELEDFGFVESHIKPDTKNKTIYCLTQKGLCFTQNIKNLEDWVKKWENK
ncbi:helix-turn-helix transcriptional regulator [Candidatus Gracilibacteria bacterium]|nr:helix-turn-helix transcriptional regulator [Candidatus Gracilibacteria bacterium]